jgi:hypothetical protein
LPHAYRRRSYIKFSGLTTPPETTNKLVFGADAMIVVEIDVPTWSREHVSDDDNNLILLDNLQLLEEVRDAANIKKYATKLKASKKYNSKLMLRRMQNNDMVLKRITSPSQTSKLYSKRKGPYSSYQEPRCWII